jgi:hypothetical protein
MILAPSTRRPFAKVFATPHAENFLAAGVDGREKRCRMGGSPGTKGHGAITETVVGKKKIFDSVRR